MLLLLGCYDAALRGLGSCRSCAGVAVSAPNERASGEGLSEREAMKCST